MNLHYRHVKKIARGEAEIHPYMVAYLLRGLDNKIPTDLYFLHTDIILYKEPKREDGMFRIITNHCIVEQPNPIFWIFESYEGVDIALGYNLQELCQCLLSSNHDLELIGRVRVSWIFSCMCEHLKWIIKQNRTGSGKVEPVGFSFPRRGFANVEDMYYKFNQIVIKFIKYYGKDFCELRSTRKYKKPCSLLV